jgi:hypothetical protein
MGVFGQTAEQDIMSCEHTSQISSDVPPNGLAVWHVQYIILTGCPLQERAESLDRIFNEDLGLASSGNMIDSGRESGQGRCTMYAM